MPDTDPLLIQKPKSVWNRDVSLKFDKLGKSVIDGTLKGLSGDYAGVVGELLSAIGAVGTKDLTPGESAWMLITLASARSVTTIVRQPGVTVSIHNDEIKRVVDMLGEKLDEMGTSVDTSIFNAPGTLGYVAPYQRYFQADLNLRLISRLSVRKAFLYPPRSNNCGTILRTWFPIH